MFRSLFQAPRGILITLVALVVATGLKLAWATQSLGSVDAMLFFNFAARVHSDGSQWLYEHNIYYNHTPLTSALIHGLYLLSAGQFSAFSIALRVVGIVADVTVVLGLLHVRRITGRPPWWALVLFAASPVSLIVSGFHGNIDPIMVAFLFFAGVALLHGRAGWSGVLWALACNVKIVPLVLGPLFFFFWWQRRQARAFTLPAAVILLIGSAWPLLHCPLAYYRNVFAYGGYWGGWGIGYFLRLTGWPAVQAVTFYDLPPVPAAIMAGLKGLMITGMIVLGWRRRAVLAEHFSTTLAAAWALFFLLAPGIGTQYFIWFAPWMLLCVPRWWAALTASSLACMAVFYQMSSLRGSFPWVLCNPTRKELPYWTAVGAITWLIFLLVAIARAREWWLLPARVGMRPLVADEPANKELAAVA